MPDGVATTTNQNTNPEGQKPSPNDRTRKVFAGAAFPSAKLVGDLIGKVGNAERIDYQKVVETYEMSLKENGMFDILSQYLNARNDLFELDLAIRNAKDKSQINRETFLARADLASQLEVQPMKYDDIFLTVKGHEFLKDIESFHQGRESIIVTPFVKEVVDDLLNELLQQNAVYLVGETGTGKTEIARYVAELLYANTHQSQESDPNQTHYQLISCSGETDKFDLFPNTTLVEQNGATISKVELGTILTAMKEGQVVILDEINTLPSNLIVSLNEILKKKPGDTYQYGDTVVTVEKGFAIIGTGNEGGNYLGRNELDPSVRNRFTVKQYEGLPQIIDGDLKLNDSSYSDMDKGVNVGLAIKANHERELFQIALKIVSIPEVRENVPQGFLDIPENKIVFKYPAGIENDLWSFAKFAKFTQMAMKGSINVQDEGLTRVNIAGVDIELKDFKHAITNRTFVKILRAWQEEGFHKPLWSYIDKYYFNGFPDDPISMDNLKIMKSKAKLFGAYPEEGKKEEDIKTYITQELQEYTLSDVLHMTYDLTGNDKRTNFMGRSEFVVPNGIKEEIDNMYKVYEKTYESEYKELNEGGCPVSINN